MTWLKLTISAFLMLNATLLSAYSFTGEAIFSSINNSLAAAFSIYCVALTIFKGKIIQRHPIFVILLVTCASVTVAVHVGTLNSTDIVKFYSLFLFYGVGRYVLARNFMSKWLAAALAVLIVLGALGTTRVYDPATAFSYFPNANTATLYVSALLFVLSQLIGTKAIFIQIGQVLFFQKVGSILSVALSLLWIYVVKMSVRSFLILSAIFLTVFAAMYFGLLDRFSSVLYALVGDLSQLGIEGVARMSYDEIIARQNSTDLSGYFRVKHWVEIANLYISGGPITYALGYGPGMTPEFTSSGLVPHNDYIRVLAEFGVLNFLMFTSLNFHAYISLSNRNSRIIFLSILIYFFSENLIDNYASMLMLYMAAGYFSRSHDARGSDVPHKSQAAEVR